MHGHTGPPVLLIGLAAHCMPARTQGLRFNLGDLNASWAGVYLWASYGTQEFGPYSWYQVRDDCAGAAACALLPMHRQPYCCASCLCAACH